MTGGADSTTPTGATAAPPETEPSDLPAAEGDAPSATSETLIVTRSDGGVELVDRQGLVLDTVAPGEADPRGVQATPASTGAIAFTSDADGATVWVDGTTSNPATGLVPFYYDWSPDGGRLALLGNENGQVGGRIVEPDTGTVTSVGTAAPHFLAWSPDSAHLAVHRNDQEVVVIDGAGDERFVTTTPGLFQAPDWIDDGTLLVVSPVTELEVSLTPTLPLGELRTWPLDGSPGRALAEVIGSVVFAVSPDRTTVAVLTEFVALIDLATGATTSVPGAGDEQPVFLQWSPTGDHLLIGSATPEATILPAVWDGDVLQRYPAYLPTPTFVTEYLPFWGQYVRHEQPWSPAGDAFAYSALDDETHARILIQPLEATDPVDVTDGVHVGWR